MVAQYTGFVNVTAVTQYSEPARHSEKVIQQVAAATL